ncbi:hypothetical protein B0J17DRAFT_645088 [Rhizoctonia solani]|nr:hypothetical protein B0J17DRAFT_645088 [Rhizoctonia solani]
MLPSAPNAPERTSNTQSLFKPPGGGDLTLRSRDGVNFLVHSTILKFASSVFHDMIATHTTKTIELTENTSDISNLLGFIYPNRLPLTIGPEMLPGCLEAVQRYGVEGAIEIIDELASLDTPLPTHTQVSLV